MIYLDVVDTPNSVYPDDIVEFDITSDFGAELDGILRMFYNPLELEVISGPPAAFFEGSGIYNLNVCDGSGSILVKKKVLKSGPAVITTKFVMEVWDVDHLIMKYSESIEKKTTVCLPQYQNFHRRQSLPLL
ncbi:MAG: hypothetical protein APR63_14315 [Desulfuromonas sp. SDB]|nr:MAG: hypothetical protein APR63_14315 [Desulfuromonas sp. SDB]